MNEVTEHAEDEVFRLAVKVASDMTPFGLALGEMLRTLNNMDGKLAKAVADTADTAEPDSAEEPRQE